MELELSNEIRSLLTTVEYGVEVISNRMQGFDENKLEHEQVDQIYFDEFTNDITSHVANAVNIATQYRILPMLQLEVLKNIVNSLISLLIDICKKIMLKIGLVLREDQQTEIILYRFHRSLSTPKDELLLLKDGISMHIASLGNGTFFLSLEKVWYPHNISALVTRIRLPRKILVEIEGLSNSYERTATKAIQTNAECAIDCDRTATSSNKYINMFDIFGNRDGTFPFAHLMPNSKSCASLWFAVVPWVLLLAENVTLNYDLAKKCIHGVIVNDRTVTVTAKEPSISPLAAAVTDRIKRKKAPPGATATIETPHLSDVLPMYCAGKNMNIAVDPTRKNPRDNADDNDSSLKNNDTKRQKLMISAKMSTGEKQRDGHTTRSQILTRNMTKVNAQNRESVGDNEDGNVCKTAVSTNILDSTSTNTGSRQCDATKLNNDGEKHRKRGLIDSKNSDVAFVGDNVLSDTKTTTSSTGTGPRVRNVGIKHFRSNRIKLSSQAEYFETDLCLLIVPILTPTQVANWSGGGYSAIVLAGAGIKVQDESKAEEVETTPPPASLVYRMVRACEGSTPGEFLATRADLEKATALLLHTVRALAHSCKKTYKKESKNTVTQLINDIANKPNTKRAYEEILGTKPKIPVPIINTDYINHESTVLNIRKVTFTDVNNIIRFHFAPDPALLVAKAASNWLKRQNVNLLPGCNFYEDNDTDSVTSDDDDIISFSQEADLRGWTIKYSKIPEEINLSEYTDINRDDNDFLSVYDED